MRGRWFGLLVVLTALAAASQPAAYGYRKATSELPVNRPLKTTVAFQLYQGYLVVVQGSVGPLKGLNLLLDTGASRTVLSPQLARRLHLNTAPTGVAVLNGNVQGGLATAPSIQVGPIRRDNIGVLIEDLSFLQGSLPFQIDGIAGLDLLGESAFVIDYTSREVRFGAVPSMPDSIPLQRKDGLAFVDATIDHAPVRLLLDTGASSLVLFKIALEPAPGGAQRSAGIGSLDRKLTRQISLRLGDEVFGDKAAFVVANYRDAGHDFDGIMSPVALGITRVAVDLGRGTLAFTREP